MAMRPPFWETKRLEELTREEWESLCDGCARCCLRKLEDEDTGAVYYTDVACRLLDRTTCRCRRYGQRRKLVPDCVGLTPEAVHRFSWMPSTCAYRLLAEGKPLPPWHPLISGDPESVHRAGISVRGRVVAETDIDEAELEQHLVDWPARA
ncbi:MAG TPA: YcgN family cysteine cluster protein [Gammaproteobacteria bacterium]|nr:YcgN family cysteine cluster protein [Gammaproteobacteria bacterium]